MTSKERNLQIKNETQKNANTANRVGSALEALRVLNGGETIVNTTDSEVISANTLTPLNFEGTRIIQNELSLFDDDGNVTPINEGDVIVVGITFSFVIPSGNNNYFSVYFIVDEQIFRGQTYPIVKAQGETEYITFECILPVGETFKDLGGNLFIETSAEIEIENRYKFAQRIFLAP
jgi:hypothetical protein